MKKLSIQSIFRLLVFFYKRWWLGVTCLVGFLSLLVFAILASGNSNFLPTAYEIDCAYRFNIVMSQDKQNVAVIITVYRQDGLGVCTYVILEKYEEIDLASISSKSGLTSEEPLFFFYRYKQGHKQKIEMNSVYLACNECLVKVCDISLYNFFEIDHDRNIKIIKQKLTKRFTKSGIEFL